MASSHGSGLKAVLVDSWVASTRSALFCDTCGRETSHLGAVKMGPWLVKKGGSDGKIMVL